MTRIEKQDRIHKEIRRRALERARLLARNEQKMFHTKHTLDALEEVTGLPRADLERIADEVNGTYFPEDEGAFSIKNQLIFALILGFAFVSTLVILLYLV